MSVLEAVCWRHCLLTCHSPEEFPGAIGGQMARALSRASQTPGCSLQQRLVPMADKSRS